MKLNIQPVTQANKHANGNLHLTKDFFFIESINVIHTGHFSFLIYQKSQIFTYFLTWTAAGVMYQKAQNSSESLFGKHDGHGCNIDEVQQLPSVNPFAFSLPTSSTADARYEFCLQHFHYCKSPQGLSPSSFCDTASMRSQYIQKNIVRT